MDWETLIATALEARIAAYAPYSGFQVGAAVLTADGSVYAGCNIENRTFGLTVCAERVAIGSAVTAGQREVRAVAVVTDTEPPSPPCGLCREMLTEFGGPETRVLLANLDGSRVEHRLGDLLPYPFEFPSR